MTIVKSTYSQSTSSISNAAKPNWKRNIGVISLLLVIVCGIAVRFCGLAEKRIWFVRRLKGKKHPLFLCQTFEGAIIASRRLPARARVEVLESGQPAIPADTDGIRIINFLRRKQDLSTLVPALKKSSPNVPISVQNPLKK